jgi:hypothetical protein
MPKPQPEDIDRGRVEEKRQMGDDQVKCSLRIDVPDISISSSLQRTLKAFPWRSGQRKSLPFVKAP